MPDAAAAAAMAAAPPPPPPPGSRQVPQPDGRAEAHLESSCPPCGGTLPRARCCTARWLALRKCAADTPAPTTGRAGTTCPRATAGTLRADGQEGDDQALPQPHQQPRHNEQAVLTHATNIVIRGKHAVCALKPHCHQRISQQVGPCTSDDLVKGRVGGGRGYWVTAGEEGGGWMGRGKGVLWCRGLRRHPPVPTPCRLQLQWQQRQACGAGSNGQLAAVDPSTHAPSSSNHCHIHPLATPLPSLAP